MNQNKLVSEIVYKTKYLQQGESFEEGMDRIAGALSEDRNDLFRANKDILFNQRLLMGGRIQASVGATKKTTPLNCYVSGTIGDSLADIAEIQKEALQTLRLGGGIGYDFSTLRPVGARISSLDSTSCGPVGNDVITQGFMDWFDAGCGVIRSAGHRRGAQMGVLRVDHPDIRHFIRAKRNETRLTNFNISIAVTDEFMYCLKEGLGFDLRFNGTVYERVDARNLWAEIMRNTWDWAEPGVLFIDRINEKNNLWYCEEIAATNPCGEQPLPPYGACLLGSYNLTQYVNEDKTFNYSKLEEDSVYVTRMLDNVLDQAIYPLPQQREEALNKRRMGIGVTGLADCVEAMGHKFGSDGSLDVINNILEEVKLNLYYNSIYLAEEKGMFPALDPVKHIQSGFMSTMPKEIRDGVKKTGIRNSHLTSIAPTGTISLAAGNVSSGIEPPFTSGLYSRTMFMPDGSKKDFTVQGYSEANLGVVDPVTADKLSAEQHVDILNIASSQVDSSVSKTCNVGDDVSFDSFTNLYEKAFYGGASGCTTFRASGKRFGILNTIDEEVKEEVEGAACYIDPDTGQKSCE